MSRQDNRNLEIWNELVTKGLNCYACSTIGPNRNKSVRFICEVCFDTMIPPVPYRELGWPKSPNDHLFRRKL